MLISTKGRYAIRVMIDLAEQGGQVFVPLKEIALRQDISLKYLENIMSILSKANFVVGLQGKGGGYKLSKDATEYTIGSILKVTEGSLATVACLQDPNSSCARSQDCRTLPMWKEFDQMVDNYFESIQLSQLVQTKVVDNFVI